MSFPRGAGLALLAAFLSAVPAHAEEIIHRFDSQVEVHTDGSLTVHETIAVRAENREIRHGLRRDFPVLYQNRWKVFTRVPFQVMAVRQDGYPQTFHLGTGDKSRSVYIGRADSYVSPGDHTYELIYTTNRQLGFFPDHDELYWNLTGNDWFFPIQAARATVILPSGAQILETNAYTGVRGARGTDFTRGRDAQGHPTFQTTRALMPGEGLTIYVSWPKGVIPEPTTGEKFLRLLKDNRDIVRALIALVVVVLYYVLVWIGVGRDPGKGTVIPQYEPPHGLSAPAARYILKMGYDNKVFTAALLEAAVKGDIKIEENSSVYTLKGTEQGTRGLWDGEAKAIEKLLGSEQQITLINSNHVRLQLAIGALKTALKLAYEKTAFLSNSGWFLTGFLFSILAFLLQGYLGSDQPQRLFVSVFILIWLSIWTIGVFGLVSSAAFAWWSVFTGKTPQMIRMGVFTPREASSHGLLRLGSALFLTLFSLPFIAGEVFALVALTQMASLGTALLLPALAGVNVLFYILLKAPTRLGRKLMDDLEGFRMYLNAAEKEELNFRNPPTKTPQLFEALLPYALALDVENEWSEKFAGVLARAQAASGTAYSPVWYASSSPNSWSTLGPRGFTSSLAGAFSSAVSSASAAPGSSSGGGGGGSSGGGGGGGGGGGW